MMWMMMIGVPIAWAVDLPELDWEVVPLTTRSTSLVGTYADVAMLDVDGDGIDDLVALAGGRRSDTSLVWFPGTGDGGFEDNQTFPAEIGGMGGELFVADMDDDGDDDVVIHSYSGLTVIDNTLEGWVVTQTVQTGGTPTWGGEITIADVTGDGVPDVVACYCTKDEDYHNVRPDRIEVHVGSPSGLGPAVDLHAAAPAGHFPASFRQVQAVDFDGDGDLDLAYWGEVLPPDRGAWRDFLGVYEGGPEGLDSTPVVFEWPDAYWLYVAWLADGDGDGDLDVWAGDDRSHALSWIPQTAAFDLDSTPSTISFDIGLGWYPVRADIDGDGDEDLLAHWPAYLQADWQEVPAQLLLNDGGDLTPTATLVAPTQFQRGHALDVDADDDLDLILLGVHGSDDGPGSVVLHRNPGISIDAPEPEDPPPSGGAPGPRSCGCSNTAPPTSIPLLIALGAFGQRRRRDEHPS